MLRNFKEIRGYGIEATDGSLGKVDDLYFDDCLWTVRYFVVDTGGWLTGRKVLIAPEAAGQPDIASRRLSVSLNKEQVKDSPGIGIDLPVSRQNELELRKYYDWPSYWDAYPAGLGAGPLLYPLPAETSESEQNADSYSGDPNLRSANEVTGYRIAASDGEIGHVEDYLIDDSDWALRYLIIDTRNWLPGRKVIVAPAWADDIDWAERLVHVEVTRKTIEESPEYDPSKPIERGYEEDLHGHFGREGYWM